MPVIALAWSCLINPALAGRDALFQYTYAVKLDTTKQQKSTQQCTDDQNDSTLYYFHRDALFQFTAPGNETKLNLLTVTPSWCPPFFL
jgi:hypothetical protein